MSKDRSHDLNALGLSIRSFDDSPFMKAMRDLENSPAMRAIRELENNPAIRALRDMESSPMARMIRDLENNRAMRGIRETKFQFDSAKSMVRLASESTFIQRAMMEQTAQSTKLTFDQFDSPVRKILSQFEDAQRQFGHYDRALRSISPLQKMVDEANKLARAVSASIAAQSSIDPAIFVGVNSLAEQFAVVSAATSETQFVPVGGKTKKNTEEGLRWDQRSIAIQALYIITFLASLLAVAQSISGFLSSNQADKTNQLLSQIVEQLHQLDPSTGRYYVTTRNARMRSGPSQNDAVIFMLPAGTTVTITASEGDWLGGAYTNDVGVEKYGWIYRKNLIRKLTPSLSSDR